MFGFKRAALLAAFATCVVVSQEQQCEAGVPDCQSPDYPLGFPVDTPCAEYNEVYSRPNDLGWALGLSAVTAALMAFGMGANDAANSWGTSVGSGAISVRGACILGGICEWIGAAALGAGVSTTIRQGVADIDDPDCWACGYCDSKIGVYTVGMFAAVVGAAGFLLLATFSAMPVSATHAIVGAVVGMTIVGTSTSCLNWGFDGLGGIIASWVISPLLAGIVGFGLYYLTKRITLDTQDPLKNTLRLTPWLFLISFGTSVYLILAKSSPTKNLDPLIQVGVSIGFGAILALVVQFFFIPKIKSKIDTVFNPSEATLLAPNANMETKQYSDRDKAIYVYRYLLVLVAALGSFAHGANDTANATGAFSAVYGTYYGEGGLYGCDGEAPNWIVAVAGGFVCLGINVLGANVMKTVGSDLAEVNFHTGFCINFAATISVITATVLGFPVSTTHCQVGAVVFVGLASVGYKNVAWGLFGKIGASWVLTIPIAGGIAAFCVFFFQRDIRDNTSNFPASAWVSAGVIAAGMLFLLVKLGLWIRDRRQAQGKLAEGEDDEAQGTIEHI